MIKADVDRAAAAGASEEEQKKIIEQVLNIFHQYKVFAIK